MLIQTHNRVNFRSFKNVVINIYIYIDNQKSYYIPKKKKKKKAMFQLFIRLFFFLREEFINLFNSYPITNIQDIIVVGYLFL